MANIPEALYRVHSASSRYGAFRCFHFSGKYSAVSLLICQFGLHVVCARKNINNRIHLPYLHLHSYRSFIENRKLIENSKCDISFNCDRFKSRMN